MRSVFDHRPGIHPDGIGFEQSDLPEQSAGEPVPQKCFIVHRANKNTDNAVGCLRLFYNQRNSVYRYNKSQKNSNSSL